MFDICVTGNQCLDQTDQSDEPEKNNKERHWFIGDKRKVSHEKVQFGILFSLFFVTEVNDRLRGRQGGH